MKRLMLWWARRAGVKPWELDHAVTRGHEVECNCLGDGWAYASFGGKRVACAHCPAGERWRAANPDARWCCPSFKGAS